MEDKIMGKIFLSDDWFNEFYKIKDSLGNIELPEKLKNVIINLNVTGGPEGEKNVHFKEGSFYPGFNDDAKTTLILSHELAKKGLLENDTKAAMKGFMTRQIKVKGDIKKMLSLASIKSEGKLDELRSKALQMTE
jgi:hypothetical protein